MTIRSLSPAPVLRKLPGLDRWLGTPATRRLCRLQRAVDTVRGPAIGELRDLVRAMWPDAAGMVLYHSRKHHMLTPDRVIAGDGRTIADLQSWHAVLPTVPKRFTPFTDGQGIVGVEQLACAVRRLADAGCEYDALDPHLRTDEDDEQYDPGYEPVPFLDLRPAVFGQYAEIIAALAEHGLTAHLTEAPGCGYRIRVPLPDGTRLVVSDGGTGLPEDVVRLNAWHVRHEGPEGCIGVVAESWRNICTGSLAVHLGAYAATYHHSLIKAAGQAP